MALAAATGVAAAAQGVPQAEIDALKAELARTRAQLDSQERRLRALEAGRAAPAPQVAASAAPPPGAATPPAGPQPAQGATARQPDRAPPPASTPEQVGEAPPAADRPPEVAVLGDQGSIVTRRGQLTGEAQFDYARADRNRAIARGASIIEVINIGIFNLNEVRQDVLTLSGQLRYGLTDRLEIGVRMPLVFRQETFILSPLPGDNEEAARTIDQSTSGRGVGDLEFSARYQLASGRGGWPFLIANLQLLAPTGSDPFKVERAGDGTALEAPTGGGFWSVSPGATAILLSDPAVLFASTAYNLNFPRSVNSEIAGTLLRRVDPGDSLAFSMGVALAVNQRTTLNFGYAHNWVFGTFTEQRTGAGTVQDPFVETATTSRDLQIGRLLFGVTYRTSAATSINWSVEVGATDDATDLRTSLRIPFTLVAGVP
jgi:hypothetical protein